MKIAYLAAGAAGMYCGSCLHDNTLAAALLDLGEDVLLVPTYTPLRSDEPSVSQRRVFFGGINVYLQQKWPLFRHTPAWLDRIFDHPALLSMLAGRASSVDPAQLGDMTVSMLRGEEGNQRKELRKLVDWLLADVQPDVVHLSNSMMLGMAHMISQQCGPPVVCSLSGEDLFLEKLTPPYYDQARRLLGQRASQADAFVAMNSYYADYMAAYLQVDRRRIHVIPHGLRLEGYERQTTKRPESPKRIGFLARVCADKGLHLLVEACLQLSNIDDLPPFELHAAGYLGSADRGYLTELIETAAANSAGFKFHYHGELGRAEKIAFLRSLDLFSTPTVYPESKGLPALEALACAIPVVMPHHGTYPELITDTGGGLLCRPHEIDDLAKKLELLLRDSERAIQFGESGRQAIHDRYHATAMAENTLALYRKLT